MVSHIYKAASGPTLPVLPLCLNLCTRVRLLFSRSHSLYWFVSSVLSEQYIGETTLVTVLDWCKVVDRDCMVGSEHTCYHGSHYVWQRREQKGDVKRNMDQIV